MRGIVKIGSMHIFPRVEISKIGGHRFKKGKEMCRAIFYFYSEWWVGE